MAGRVGGHGTGRYSGWGCGTDRPRPGGQSEDSGFAPVMGGAVEGPEQGGPGRYLLSRSTLVSWSKLPSAHPLLPEPLRLYTVSWVLPGGTVSGQQFGPVPWGVPCALGVLDTHL